MWTTQNPRSQHTHHRIRGNYGLDVLTGAVIGQCMPRHRHQEWFEFLKTIDREVPQDLAIHLILDNYATHQTPGRPHVAGQSSSVPPAFHPDILILVEPGETLAALTDKTLRRGAFHSVPDLIASIQENIDSHNDDPRPYMWIATAESILARVARGRIALEKVS